MAQSSEQPDDDGPAADIPLGPVKGRVRVHSRYNSLGRIRPFGPGEGVDMGGGNYANEMTWTTQLGDKWSVIPGLWLINGVPTKVDEDQAAEYAQASGLNWPLFDSQKEADAFAQQREAFWESQGLNHDTTAQAPLWSRPWPPNVTPAN
jgi:hypothetical protein